MESTRSAPVGERRRLTTGTPAGAGCREEVMWRQRGDRSIVEIDDPTRNNQTFVSAQVICCQEVCPPSLNNKHTRALVVPRGGRRASVGGLGHGVLLLPLLRGDVLEGGGGEDLGEETREEGDLTEVEGADVCGRERGDEEGDVGCDSVDRPEEGRNGRACLGRRGSEWGPNAPRPTWSRHTWRRRPRGGPAGSQTGRSRLQSGPGVRGEGWWQRVVVGGRLGGINQGT